MIKDSIHTVFELKTADQKEAVCREILWDLPQWFGLPDATEEYCLGVRNKRFYVTREKGRYIGFMSIKDHNRYSSEIFVCGVRYKYRNKGVGTSLIKHIIEVLQAENREFLSVKTLSSHHCSKEYAQTREFYLAQGFIPLEVFPELWGKENPCLLMVMKL